ncbi:unnamed protein product, partial [marine sediment metagenome]
PEWRRIGAFHLEDDGTVGAVWLAHDMQSSVVHCYDAAKFSREVAAVIAQGIGARGRHYPFAWRKQDKAFAEKLEEAGINILPDPSHDDPKMAEVISREIWQRLRSSQLRVDKRVGDWLEEYRQYFRDESNVPTKGFPLMSATRHAIEMLDYAEAERSYSQTKNFNPRISVV